MITSTELVLVTTGELIDLSNTRQVVDALEHIRRLEYELRETKKALTDAVAEECQKQGTKTLHLGDVSAELTGGSKVEWDMDRLAHLKDLGLPDDRWNALVTIEQTYKVNAAEAKRIAAANTAYANVIETARQVVPASYRVSVRR